MSHQWDHAAASYCHSLGHAPRIEIVACCRLNSTSGDAGPKLGHENCLPAFDGEALRSFLIEGEES